MRRDDTVQRTYFRSERIFSTNGSWYFATREGHQGPFRARPLVEAALRRFLCDRRELQEFQKSRTDRWSGAAGVGISEGITGTRSQSDGIVISPMSGRLIF
jgi:hypothetical protein